MGKIYTQKPPMGSQVNWGHPLSKNLKLCYLLNEGGGNIATNIAVPTRTGRLDRVYGTTLNSKGFTGTYGSGTYIIPNRSYQHIVGKNQLSMLVRFMPTATTENYGIFGGKLSSDTQTNFYIVWLNNGNLECRWKNNDGSTKDLTPQFKGGGTNVAGTVVYTVNGAVANVYIDGILKATRSDLDGEIECSDSIGYELCLGALKYDDGTINAQITGHIYYAYLWDRVLTATEIRSLYASPYQFITRPNLSLASKYYATSGVTLGGSNKNICMEW